MYDSEFEKVLELIESEPALVVFSLTAVLVFAILVLVVIFGTIRRIAIAKQVERSRREIAAYVAEGSISADEGERLLGAKPRVCAPARHGSRHNA